MLQNTEKHLFDIYVIFYRFTRTFISKRERKEVI